MIFKWTISRCEKTTLLKKSELKLGNGEDMAEEEIRDSHAEVTITIHVTMIKNLKEDLMQKEKRLAKVSDEKLQAQNEIITLQSACQAAKWKLESANSAHAKELKILRVDFA
ncbi:hypothetical protein R1flu_008475 [Riccia fluitans]|uniref:Uncharacterized protein n=1 Tax=Riccia fluitans TaxID=41844 RepID=A0ABD1YCF8_9MARC